MGRGLKSVNSKGQNWGNEPNPYFARSNRLAFKRMHQRDSFDELAAYKERLTKEMISSPYKSSYGGHDPRGDYIETLGKMEQKRALQHWQASQPKAPAAPPAPPAPEHIGGNHILKGTRDRGIKGSSASAVARDPEGWGVQVDGWPGEASEQPSEASRKMDREFKRTSAPAVSFAPALPPAAPNPPDASAPASPLGRILPDVGMSMGQLAERTRDMPESQARQFIEGQQRALAYPNATEQGANRWRHQVFAPPDTQIVEAPYRVMRQRAEGQFQDWERGENDRRAQREAAREAAQAPNPVNKFFGGVLGSAAARASYHMGNFAGRMSTARELQNVSGQGKFNAFRTALFAPAGPSQAYQLADVGRSMGQRHGVTGLFKAGPAEGLPSYLGVTAGLAGATGFLRGRSAGSAAVHNIAIDRGALIEEPSDSEYAHYRAGGGGGTRAMRALDALAGIAPPTPPPDPALDVAARHRAKRQDQSPLAQAQTPYVENDALIAQAYKDKDRVERNAREEVVQSADDRQMAGLSRSMSSPRLVHRDNPAFPRPSSSPELAAAGRDEPAQAQDAERLAYAELEHEGAGLDEFAVSPEERGAIGLEANHGQAQAAPALGQRASAAIRALGGRVAQGVQGGIAGIRDRLAPASSPHMEGGMAQRQPQAASPENEMELEDLDDAGEGNHLVAELEAPARNGGVEEVITPGVRAARGEDPGADPNTFYMEEQPKVQGNSLLDKAKAGVEKVASIKGLGDMVSAGANLGKSIADYKSPGNNKAAIAGAIVGGALAGLAGAGTALGSEYWGKRKKDEQEQAGALGAMF